MLHTFIAGVGVMAMAGTILISPSMHNASYAADIAAECAALAAIPSIGPAPAELSAKCAAEQQIKATLPPPPAIIFDHTVFGVENTANNDLVKFSLKNPGTLNVVGNFTTTSFVNGCDFDNSGFYEKLYCLDSASPADVYTLNTTDGTKTVIGQATNSGGESFTGLATDPTTGVMYAVASTCGSSSLYTVNLATGAASLVGPVTNGPCMINLGADNDGVLYGVDIVNDNLIRIDKATGAGTIVGSIGYDANFGQGMDFDERTNTCFLFAFNNGTFQPELRTCDTTLGLSTLVGKIGPDLVLKQVGGAGISRFTWPKFSPAMSGAGARP